VGASAALGALGVRWGGVAGRGKEFSHWIPNRAGGPRSIWNGNYVPKSTHALSDPYRYRFMPRSWCQVQSKNVPQRRAKMYQLATKKVAPNV
jgi:hypothetical protein